MADSQTFWASGFWATGFWADDFWAGGVAPVVVVPPAGGGRRIYDPDEHRKKYEPLSKKERRELDRMFRERAAPRYVSPKPAVVVQKRITPFVPLAVPGFEPPKPVDRIAAAKQFMALDALESLLDRIEYQPRFQAEHRAAIQHAERLRLEMAEQARVAWETAEAERMEQERLAADEDEMMMVLLAIHDAD